MLTDITPRLIILLPVLLLVLAVWLLTRPRKAEYYTQEEAETFAEAAAEAFGEDYTVFHELVSPDVHIDILIFKPTERCPFYTLCTMGVGAHRMKVPAAELQKEAENDAFVRTLIFPGWDRVELMLYMPDDWRPAWFDENADDEEKERSYWPIQLLKDAARYMVHANTWYAYSQSFAADGRDPFAKGIPYCAAAFISPLPDCLKPGFTLPAGGYNVSVLQMLPLRESEHDALMQGGIGEWLRDNLPADTEGMKAFMEQRMNWM